MNFSDFIKKSVLEGFQNNDISTTKIIIILGVTLLLSLYVYYIYSLVNRSTMYDKDFHVSMAMISIVTAGIVVAMQSNIVISLGMVGALSIVRFRTAIKSPMDLLFLFWSIGNGIICGATLFETAVVVSLIVTAGIFVLEALPVKNSTYLLVINGNNSLEEEKLCTVLKQYSVKYTIKARNLKKDSIDFMIEIKTKKECDLLKALKTVQGVEQFSLMTKEGEVRI